MFSIKLFMELLNFNTFVAIDGVAYSGNFTDQPDIVFKLVTENRKELLSYLNVVTH